MVRPPTPDFEGDAGTLYHDEDIKDAPDGTAPHLRGKAVIVQNDYQGRRQVSMQHNDLPSDIRASGPAEAGTAVYYFGNFDADGRWVRDGQTVGETGHYKIQVFLVDLAEKTRVKHVIDCGRISTKDEGLPTHKVIEFLSALPRR
jgi:hypothetical protein